MRRVVLTDTDVLWSRTVRDYLVYAHGRRLIDVRWSAKILDDLTRTLTRKYGNHDAHQRLRGLLERHFPDASIDVTPADVAVFDELGLPDPDDAHVLAAAYAAQADILCTNNTKDFPVEAVRRSGAELMIPDEVLCLLACEFPREMRQVHQTVVERNPRLTEDQTLAKLVDADCPGAARTMAELSAGMRWVSSHKRGGPGLTG